MDSNRLIDAQFDRAVEIVQSLPKNGPIQTGYEEKLALYSLYKQATVGNVKQSRPGMWDMLGRAKWDAWAKQKDLSPPEAKWLYVDTVQKILRKYPGATIAHELIKELSSFGGDPANLVMSGSINPSTPQEDDSSADESDDDAPGQYMPPYPREASQHVPIPQRPPPPIETDDEGADSADELPNFQPNVSAGIPRPASGISRYRTPMGMSTGIPASYTPPIGGFSGHPNSAMPHIMHQPPIPPSQPLPRYATPSAFSPPSDDRNLSSTSPSIPSSYPTASLSYPPHLSHSQTQPYAFRGNVGPNPQSPPVNDTPSAEASTSPPGHLEHAVESVQASLAALRERLEGLEVHTFGSNPTLLVRHPDGTESGADGSGSEFVWDPKSMGLWSIVFVPATHVLTRIRYVLVLILSSPASQRVLGRGGRRPGGIDVRAIVRRLVLDATFVVVAFHLLKAAWRASGVRRREVVKALRLVWFALVGKPAPRRIMIDRGV